MARPIGRRVSIHSRGFVVTLAESAVLPPKPYYIGFSDSADICTVRNRTIRRLSANSDVRYAGGSPSTRVSQPVKKGRPAYELQLRQPASRVTHQRGSGAVFDLLTPLAHARRAVPLQRLTGPRMTEPVGSSVSNRRRSLVLAILGGAERGCRELPLEVTPAPAAPAAPYCPRRTQW